MMMKNLALPTLALFAAACASATKPPPAAPPAQAADPAITVVLASELQWEQLNPARGDQSPKATNLWGDRKAPGATGFLVEFVDGFSSPPHIHNVTYRGVVIEQRVHNDDPKAEPMWMPAGSYWTQPKGAVHITSAQGAQTRAYIEIDEGPYLVRPVDQAFADDEKPVNIDAGDIPWVDASAPGGPRTATLWGSPGGEAPWGLLVELPAGASAALQGQGAAYRAVVIKGRPAYAETGAAAPTALTPGSYLGSTGAPAQISCSPDAACVLYVRAEGRFDVVSAPQS